MVRVRVPVRVRLVLLHSLNSTLLSHCHNSVLLKTHLRLLPWLKIVVALKTHNSTLLCRVRVTVGLELGLGL